MCIGIILVTYFYFNKLFLLPLCIGNILVKYFKCLTFKPVTMLSYCKMNVLNHIVASHKNVCKLYQHVSVSNMKEFVKIRFWINQIKQLQHGYKLRIILLECKCILWNMKFSNVWFICRWQSVWFYNRICYHVNNFFIY